MCCFSQPVERVSRTCIFSRLSGEGTQFVTYQMEYKSHGPNAMILPLPVARDAGEEALRFIDLSGYDNFFRDLDRGFPPLVPPPVAASRSGAPSGRVDLLAVQEIGDFVASFVPQISDFDRLDPRFVIPANVWSKIPEYGDYGFAVFQLKDLAGKPHPMAFEFPTRFEDKIFFPTVHIHDGQVHELEEFDHSLYLQAAEFDERVAEYTQDTDPSTSFVRSKRPAAEFVDLQKAKGIVSGDLLLHRKRLAGQLLNGDFVVSPAAGERHAGAFNLPGIQTLAPFAAVLPIGWIIHRRNQMRGKPA